METWKNAIWLAKVELKKSIVNLLLAWFTFSLAIFIVLMLYNNFNSPDPYHDVIFLILLTSGPFWLRNKAFKYQKMTDKLWFSPTIPMQLQLPISKDILVKSRLIIYTAYLAPFLTVLFPMFYLLDSELSKMNILSYIAFCLIWIAFSFSLGMITPGGRCRKLCYSNKEDYSFTFCTSSCSNSFLLFLFGFRWRNCLVDCYVGSKMAFTIYSDFYYFHHYWVEVLAILHEKNDEKT